MLQLKVANPLQVRMEQSLVHSPHHQHHRWPLHLPPLSTAAQRHCQPTRTHLFPQPGKSDGANHSRDPTTSTRKLARVCGSATSRLRPSRHTLRNRRRGSRRQLCNVRMMISEAEVPTPSVMASVLVWMMVAVALRELDATAIRMEHRVMRRHHPREPFCH